LERPCDDHRLTAARTLATVNGSVGRQRLRRASAMTTDELRELIDVLRRFDGDLFHVEAKRAERELPSRLWETLSAFANTPEGGIIVLGVDEAADFEVVGVANPKKLQDDLASLCSRMEPPIRAVIEPHAVNGKTVVVAEVPETSIEQKPCYYPPAGLTNGAFIRVADGDHKLSAYEVQMLLISRGQPREDERPVPEASIADLDPALVAGLLERLRTPDSSRFRALNDEAALLTVKALVRHQGRLVPSLAGLLALGVYPQYFFRSLDITFVVYPMYRVGEPGPRGERFLDNRKFDGAIPRMIRPALDALQRNMKRRAIVRGIYREDLWEYPEDAVREALVNALVHRDLSPQGGATSVQIQMFPDRLVILNTGGLFGGITVDQLGEPGVSARRNQTLMTLLEDTVIPEERRVVCENRGSGIGAILTALRRAGMGPPLFENWVSIFRVTFPNHTLLDAETLTWLERMGGYELTPSQRMGVGLARHGERLTNDLYRRFTDVDSRVATRELGDLVRRGILEQIGSRRWTTYRVVDALPADRTGTIVHPAVPEPARQAGRTGRIRADRRPAFLALLAEHGELSRAEIAAHLGLTDANARKWLRGLVAEGVVVQTSAPRSKHQSYRLASEKGSGNP